MELITSKEHVEPITSLSAGIDTNLFLEFEDPFCVWNIKAIFERKGQICECLEIEKSLNFGIQTRIDSGKSKKKLIKQLTI